MQGIWLGSDRAQKSKNLRDYAPDRCSSRISSPSFISTSPLFNSILEMIKAIAGRKCSVVITGVISWRLFLHAIKVQDMGEVTAVWEIWLYPFVFLAAIGSTLFTMVFIIQFLHAVSEVRRQ